MIAPKRNPFARILFRYLVEEFLRILSVGVYLWNEKVVPHFATRAHYINTVEIKKRQMQGLLGDQQIWAHGQDTFYNIQSFDVRSSSLVGVTIYPIDTEFHLKGLIEI